MYLKYLASIGHYIPELLATLTMVGLILIEATFGRKKESRFWFYFAGIMGLIATLSALISGLGNESVRVFTNSVTIDGFSTLAKIIMVLGTMACIYLSMVSKDIEESIKPEYSILAVGVMVGGMLLASASNMLIFYIGIETLSILSYAMASFKKTDDRSSEAGLKYALYGGVSAGIMLFGMSHIFGTLGTIHFVEMADKISGLDSIQLAILLPSFLLFFVGVGYKIACVPFHMWAPDVYEGSPVPVTTFFSIVPKIAGMAAIIRLTMELFSTATPLSIAWIGLLSMVAAITMTVGNVAAIGQRSVKRMLAYSSISHAGVMLLGAVVANEAGASSILFYGVNYLFMTLVAFYIVSFVQDKYGNDHFERFNGLIKSHPLMAILMTIVMFSLSGIPPLSGFVAKFNIFAAVVEKKYYVLALIAGVNSVISLYYYSKIVRFMIFKDSESDTPVMGFTYRNQFIIAVMALPILIFGLFWSDLMSLTSGAKVFIN